MNLSKKGLSTILSLFTVCIWATAIIWSYFVERKEGGGIIFVAYMYFILSSILGVVLAMILLYRRCYMQNLNRFSISYIFTGMFNFAIGTLSLLDAIANKQIPDSLMFIILFLVNLLTGIFMLFDIYFSKSKNVSY
jgi:hypothetical protein